MVGSDYVAAIGSLNQLRVKTPDEQAVYGLLMICYAVTGQIDQAERVYREYENMTRESLGLPPHTTLEHLRRIIQERQFSPSQSKSLIDGVLQIDHQSMDIRLQTVLFRLGEAIGVHPSPIPSSAYHSVLQQAQTEAERHGVGLIGTPHLFLALYAHQDATINYIRDALPTDIERSVYHVLGKRDPHMALPATYTLELHTVLQSAQDIAKNAEAHHVDIPHLWLALFREEDLLFGQLLERYGISRQILVDEIERTEGGR